MKITDFEYVVNKTTMEYKARVHTPSYNKELWLWNCDLPFNDEVMVLNKYWKLSEDELSIIEMDDSEKTAVEELITEAAKRAEILRELEESDRKMARAGEEIIDNILNDIEISQYTLGVIARRKELRESL